MAAGHQRWIRCRPGQARTASRFTSGARSARAATPRPRSRGGPWRCRGAAWRRCASSGAAGAGPANGRGALPGARPGLRVQGWHTADREQRNPRVPGDHQESRARSGLGAREMRHTFVSVLSANGVPVESIALLAGHDRTATTESVYRHEIRPALTQGAEVMDKIFG